MGNRPTPNLTPVILFTFCKLKQLFPAEPVIHHGITSKRRSSGGVQCANFARANDCEKMRWRTRATEARTINRGGCATQMLVSRTSAAPRHRSRIEALASASGVL